MRRFRIRAWFLVILKSKTSVYGERKEDNFAIINYLKDYQIPVTSSEDSGANRNFVFGTTFEKLFIRMGIWV